MNLLRVSLLLALGISAAPALEITIEPDGTIGSLQAARDAVRKARADGDTSAARVIVTEGTYPIEAPIAFEPQDSRVKYEAAPGARPLFTGGRQITGWVEGEDGRWTAKVDPGWRFEALWINGRRATRARTPNSGFIQATGQPLQALSGIPLKGNPTRSMLQLEAEPLKGMSGLSPEELHEVNVVVYFSWDIQRHRVAGFEPATGVFQFTSGLKREFFSLAPFHNVHVENYRAAVDAPGEWFLGRDGAVTYQPLADEKIEQVNAWAPVAGQWLVFKGDSEKKERVSGIEFRGLRFAHQGWTLPPEGAAFGQAESALGAAIEADGARGILFEDCEFAHTMTNVAWFRHDCREVTVRKCHLHDLGAGGIKIGETGVPPDPERITAHVLVENCIIHGGGRFFTGAHGIWIGQNHDNTIRHCDIADFYYTPIAIGWVWGYKPTPTARNVVEYCHLHHYGWGVMSDMGAVYTLGQQPGTVIRGCHIHDAACAAYGGWGMYNDEGSTGILWENNLVYRTQSGAYHQHYGRGNIVRNNILAFNHEYQVRWSKPEQFLGLAFENNIVLFDEGRLFGHVDRNWFTGHVWLNRNVYWQTEGGPVSDFAAKTWSEWQSFGNDPESIIADPLFVAPKKGDWTLKPESPAIRLGFKPFDWRKAGVTGDDAWKKLAAKEYPPVTFVEKPKPKPLMLNEDFETTAVGALPAHGAKVGKQPNSILKVVRGGADGSGRCLELVDGPEVEPQYNPHFYYEPHHEAGVTRVGFHVRLEPGYVLHHEWRDNSNPYLTGPQLIFEKGAVKANGRKLIDLPAEGWLQVELEAGLGEDNSGLWNCSLKLPGGEMQRFEGLKFLKPGMKKITWLGFSSNGNAPAKAWLDQIVITNSGR